MWVTFVCLENKTGRCLQEDVLTKVDLLAENEASDDNETQNAVMVQVRECSFDVFAKSMLLEVTTVNAIN